MTDHDPTVMAPGLRRAAVMLLALGKGPAAKVLAELEEREAARLTKALLDLGAVPEEEIRASLVDLGSGMGKLSDVSAPDVTWVQDVLADAHGADKARQMVADATRPEPFAWVPGVDADALTTVLEAESPATVALVLSHLDTATAAALLRKLSEQHRAETTARISQLQTVTETSLRRIDEALLEQVRQAVAAPTRIVDGVNRAASLLGRVPRRESDKVLASLRETDPRRAQKIIEQMFTFEDVLALPSRYLQKVLGAVDSGQLAIALSGAPEELVSVVFANLTERAGQNLEEEIKFMSPKRAADVRAARREIVSTAGQLEAEGEIIRTTAVDDEDEDEDIDDPITHLDDDPADQVVVEEGTDVDSAVAGAGGDEGR